MNAVYAFGGMVVFVIIAGFTAYYFGSRSGRRMVENKTLKEVERVQDKQLQAANQDRSPGAISGSLRDGSF